MFYQESIRFMFFLSLVFYMVSCSSRDPGPPPPVVWLNFTEMELEVKGAFSTNEIKATVRPDDSTITWSIEDDSPKDCVQLRSTNNPLIIQVVAVAKGTATVVATSSAGASARVTVNVIPVSVRGLDVDRTEVFIESDGVTPATTTLKAIALPKEVDDAVFEWKWSSNSNSVPNFIYMGQPTQKGNNSTIALTATGTGEATIEVEIKNTKFKSSVSIYVTPPYKSSDYFVSLVPPGAALPIAFPIGVDDNNQAEMTQTIQISKTEVTYELWRKVYDWAKQKTSTSCTSTSNADCCQPNGQNCYTFLHKGQKGSTIKNLKFVENTTGSAQQPVTNISYCDAMVWANAFTKWINSKEGTNYQEVYRTEHPNPQGILRSSLNGGTCGATKQKPFNGFRLPLPHEWEFAARLTTDQTNTVFSKSVSMGGKTYYYTKGNSASGARGSVTSNADSEVVAWYLHNSAEKTHDVGTRTMTNLGVDANNKPIGIADMSGNVSEWVFRVPNANTLIRRGGAFNSTSEYLQVSAEEGAMYFYHSPVPNTGIRLVRND